MQITARFHANQIRNAARTIGVPLPTALTEKLDQADALVHAAEMLLGGRGDLNSAILDALEAGRDALADPLVQRRALESMLANFQGHSVADAATQRAMDRRRAALVEHADDVLEQWSDAVEQHSAALAAAAAELPTQNLSDTATIIATGLAAVEHWTAAQRAIKVWDAAASGFTAFAAAARVDTDGHRWAIFVVAEVPSAGRHVDAWSLACQGAPLCLPGSLGEFQERWVAALPADDLGVDGGLDDLDVA
jgi:hypothetical protein